MHLNITLVLNVRLQRSGNLLTVLVILLLALADVFDALTSERPYKPAWPLERAVAFIEEQAGTHFDPGLLPAFHNALPHMLEIREQFNDQPYLQS